MQCADHLADTSIYKFRVSMDSISEKIMCALTIRSVSESMVALGKKRAPRGDTRPENLYLYFYLFVKSVRP